MILFIISQYLFQVIKILLISFEVVSRSTLKSPDRFLHIVISVGTPGNLVFVVETTDEISLGAELQLILLSVFLLLGERLSVALKKLNMLLNVSYLD